MIHQLSAQQGTQRTELSVNPPSGRSRRPWSSLDPRCPCHLSMATCSRGGAAPHRCPTRAPQWIRRRNCRPRRPTARTVARVVNVGLVRVLASSITAVAAPAVNSNAVSAFIKSATPPAQEGRSMWLPWRRPCKKTRSALHRAGCALGARRKCATARNGQAVQELHPTLKRHARQHMACTTGTEKGSLCLRGGCHGMAFCNP